MALAETAAAPDPSLARIAFGPERVPERIAVLDALRGFAVLGICLRNVFVFGMPNSAYAVPFLWGISEQANVISWTLVEIFVDGSMRALFSMLFGASALLILSGWQGVGLGMSGPSREAAVPDIQAIDRYFRRLLILMGLGMVHGYILLWPHDVLFPYGLLGFFLFPLRNLSWRALMGLSLGIMLLTAMANIPVPDDADSADGPVQAQVEAVPDVPPSVAAQPQAGAPAAGDETAGVEPETDIELAALFQEWDMDILLHLGGYRELFAEYAEKTFEQQTTELYKAEIADLGALMLLGMALLKLGVFTGQRSTRFYIVLAIVGYGSGLLVNLAETIPALGFEAPFDWDVSWAPITYDLGRTLTGLAHLSAIVLIVKLNVFPIAIRFLAAAGRMALTNYLTQTLFFIFLFYGFGAGQYAAFEHYQLLLLALALGIGQIIASRIVLAHLRQGPLEWLVASLCRTKYETRPLTS